MSQRPSTEERLATLESRVAELEHQRAVQEDRDIALLARIDNFIDDLRRVERVQMRSFDEIIAHQKGQDTQIAILVEAARDHKQAIETLGSRVERIEEGQQALQAGMDQVVAILTGRAKTND